MTYQRMTISATSPCPFRDQSKALAVTRLTMNLATGAGETLADA